MLRPMSHAVAMLLCRHAVHTSFKIVTHPITLLIIFLHNLNWGSLCCSVNQDQPSVIILSLNHHKKRKTKNLECGNVFTAGIVSESQSFWPSLCCSVTELSLMYLLHLSPWRPTYYPSYNSTPPPPKKMTKIQVAAIMSVPFLLPYPHHFPPAPADLGG